MEIQTFRTQIGTAEKETEMKGRMGSVPVGFPPFREELGSRPICCCFAIASAPPAAASILLLLRSCSCFDLAPASILLLLLLLLRSAASAFLLPFLLP
jgi:hypothetical protein